MELVVECISKTGKNAGRGLKAGGQWYTAGKRMSGDFTSLHNGDAIEVDANGDFINSWKLVNASEYHATATKPSQTGGSTATVVATQEKSVITKDAYTTNKDATIARAVAFKSVVDSPYFNESIKDMGEDEAVAKIISVSEKFVTYLKEGTK